MDYTQVFAISAAGMTVERTRVDIAALNLANANTVVSANGGGFHPLQVVARIIGSVNNDASDDDLPFGSLVAQGLEQGALTGAFPSASVVPMNTTPRMSYEPGNPLADQKGFVAYAGVDAATEMVTLMSAMRAYEANVAAMNTARALALKALDIGGNGS